MYICFEIQVTDEIISNIICILADRVLLWVIKSQYDLPKTTAEGVELAKLYVERN